MNPTWIELATGAAPAAAWMLTYLLHSTVLLVAAAAIGLVLGERRAALQEVVWKCALVGGIATATLQAGLGWTPVAGAWELPGAGVARIAQATSDEHPRQEGVVGGQAAGESIAAFGAGSRLSHEGAAAEAVAAADASTTAGGSPADAGAASARAGRAARHAVDGDARASLPMAGTADAGEAGRAAGAAASSAPAVPPTTSRLAAAWPLLTVAAWLALAGLFAARLAGDYLRLARRLRERWPVADGAVAALFGRLLGKSGRRRPVGLTGSERLPVPIAWGLARPEVSLPARVLRDLSPYHQESILAHELAHVLRRDPAWLAAARAIEAVLFFQPLNRLARRRLQELAEYRCDDRAVELTGRPLELARCLTEVAAWRLAGLAALPVPSMASGSALGRRVRRLVQGERAERLPRWVRPAAVAALLAVALAAPAVTGGRPAPLQPAEEPAAATPPPAERLDDSAIDEERNAGWVLVDGRTWDELTPEEREEARRRVAEARRHAAEARDDARRASDETRAAMAEVRQRLRSERQELRSAERHARRHAGAHGEAAEAARRAHREALAEARRTLEASRQQLREVHRQHRDIDRQRLDEMRREHRERHRHLRDEIDRRLDESRRHGDHAGSAEEAARVRAEAFAAAQAGLAAARHAMPPADLGRQVSLALSGLGETLPALIAGSVQLGLGAAGAALSAVDLSDLDAEVARALAEVQRSMPRVQAEMARALAEAEDDPERRAELRQAMAELEAEMPRIRAEIAAAMAEVERELTAELPKIEAELAAAMAELEAEMPRLEAEIAAAMAEIDREWPAMEAEIAAAMAEVEREMPRIEAELAQAMAELEAEMPRIEAEIAAAMAEVEAEWPRIEAEIARAMAEVERELAALEAEIEAEEAARDEEIETEEIAPDAPAPR